MEHCLTQARLAAASGEVPVGACVVLHNQIIGTGHNAPIADCDPSAHAEIIALRAAARALNNYRLPGSWLYVTVEPCMMCVGALLHARVAGLVFGAREPKTGAVVSTANIPDNLNHCFDWQEGVLADTAAALMKDFFVARRSAS